MNLNEMPKLTTVKARNEKKSINSTHSIFFYVMYGFMTIHAIEMGKMAHFYGPFF